MLSLVRLFATPWLTRLLYPWDFPGNSIGVSCHFLLQGIFLTQGSSLHLLHWQADSLPLSHWALTCYLLDKTESMISCLCGYLGFPGSSVVKNPPSNAGDVGKIPWKRKWPLTPVFLPGKFHGERNLGWVTVHGVTKELDTASQLNMCQNPWNHPSSCGLSGKSTGFVIGKLGF